MSREIFSSKAQSEKEAKLIEEICRYRKQGNGAYEIYQKVTVECTRPKVEALVNKYDFFCKWVKDVRKLFGMDEL